jgi:outer membrane biosynthesis protein TonB
VGRDKRHAIEMWRALAGDRAGCVCRPVSGEEGRPRIAASPSDKMFSTSVTFKPKDRLHIDFIRMKILIRQGAIAVLALAGILLLSPIRSQTQDAANTRRILDRVTAVYPALANNLALHGVVRIYALVAPDGRVKAVEVKG